MSDETAVPDEAENELPPIGWSNYVPGALLLAIMVPAFVIFLWRDGSMIDWAVSRATLANGNPATLQLHMFAHGSILHIVMNSLVLFSIAPVVVHSLGEGPRAWLKFFLLFEFAGLAGAGFFLAIHQWSDTPMLGASGAIYGLVGFLIRLPKPGEHVSPIWSREMLKVMFGILKDHFWLVLLFVLPPLLTGRSGGLAWEAHLGGLLAGMLLAPYLLKRRVAS